MFKGGLTINMVGRIGKLGSRVQARLLSLAISNEAVVRTLPPPDVVQKIYLQQLYKLTGRRLPVEYEHGPENEFGPGAGLEGNTESLGLGELKGARMDTLSAKSSKVLADVSESQVSPTVTLAADQKICLAMGGPLEIEVERGGSPSISQSTTVTSMAPKRSKKKRSTAAAGK